MLGERGICGRERRERTENNIFVISCLTAFKSGTGLMLLCTDTLSPVRMAWSTRKLLDETDSRRQSAGILSPTATVMMSPGTSSEAWMRLTSPSRYALASSGEYSLSACPG